MDMKRETVDEEWDIGIKLENRGNDRIWYFLSRRLGLLDSSYVEEEIREGDVCCPVTSNRCFGERQWDKQGNSEPLFTDASAHPELEVAPAALCLGRTKAPCLLWDKF